MSTRRATRSRGGAPEIPSEPPKKKASAVGKKEKAATNKQRARASEVRRLASVHDRGHCSA
jgi:hypothetical protein